MEEVILGFEVVRRDSQLSFEETTSSQRSRGGSLGYVFCLGWWKLGMVGRAGFSVLGVWLGVRLSGLDLMFSSSNSHHPSAMEQASILGQYSVQVPGLRLRHSMWQQFQLTKGSSAP